MDCHLKGLPNVLMVGTVFLRVWQLPRSCQRQATNLFLWSGAMRLLVTLIILIFSSSTQAQYPWAYPKIRPYNPPYGGSYAPPVQGRAPLSQAMLDAHNAVRARVGVAPLEWSAELAGAAQDRASRLPATGGFGHRPNNQYGENVYAICGGIASPAQVVGYWAEEARGYDVHSNACKGVCGHYTQIVWGKTHVVGCAVATDPQREVWVCNYDPPGNVIGYRPY